MREPGPLRLPARQLLRAPVGDSPEAGDVEHLVDIERVGVERRHHRDQLAHRQVADQGARLEHDTDGTGLDGVGWGHAEQLDVAPVGTGQAEHHVDGGRLAGAVWGRAGPRFRLVHRDVDALDGAHRAERLGQVDELDAGVGSK